MKALLIVAHGSRRQSSNDEIRQLTNTVGERIGQNFQLIDCAFLELADPSIESGIRSMVKRGATHIQVMPYFLAAGTHVVNDIPDIIGSAQKQHSEVEILLTDYLGKSELIPDVLVQIATEN